MSDLRIGLECFDTLSGALVRIVKKVDDPTAAEPDLYEVILLQDAANWLQAHSQEIKPWAGARIIAAARNLREP